MNLYKLEARTCAFPIIFVQIREEGTANLRKQISEIILAMKPTLDSRTEQLRVVWIAEKIPPCLLS